MHVFVIEVAIDLNFSVAIFTKRQARRLGLQRLSLHVVCGYSCHNAEAIWNTRGNRRSGREEAGQVNTHIYIEKESVQEAGLSESDQGSQGFKILRYYFALHEAFHNTRIVHLAVDAGRTGAKTRGLGVITRSAAEALGWLLPMVLRLCLSLYPKHI